MMLSCRSLSIRRILGPGARPRVCRFLPQVFSYSTDIELLDGLSAADDIQPVNIVQDPDHARRVIKQLEALGPDAFHACDTEVADIDVKKVGPVGNGFVTCLSIFSGPGVDFGNGPYIWVDNLDSAEGTLDLFKDFLENKNMKKVWHNYSFDRHVLHNHGIDVQGLGGDTMHMARLWNTARFQRGGYSLEALSEDLLNQRKKPMKELFGVPKLKKDGSEGKELIMPSVRDLQRFSKFRERWIRYSMYDSECTWFLHEFLKEKLSQVIWYEETHPKTGEVQSGSMYDFYVDRIIPFGECLTDIERAGVHVDVDYLAVVEQRARADSEKLAKQFIEWAAKYCPDAHRMNIHSSAQKQQLLFAPFSKKKKQPGEEDDIPLERLFDVENIEGYIEPGKSKPKKNRSISIKGLGITPKKFTTGGLPAASADVLLDLAGNPHSDPPRYGDAYWHFNGGDEGRETCEALHALYQVSSINTMLNNFILPLQELSDAEGRIHCSLNLNTDTGRLSSRRPNLQNQPALEKDRYKIRDAFTAPEGKKLIVADYSQLELRLLAHITNCKSMIEAFKAGGDFHSRTALGMYDYIGEAMQKGEVLLEWDYSKGDEPAAPLLKDRFASERKNAKILNFSIAYGKTPYGLAKDFGVTKKEAAETLEKWYSDRPEVKKWQENAINTARKYGYTRTLMGRYRMLPDATLNSNNFADRKAKSHAERAAINTPIQGAAADVVMQAMLNIHSNARLRELGWRMVLQIHDEVILEGPTESSEEACALLVKLMENPFELPLKVALEVDAKIDDSWYKAK